MPPDENPQPQDVRDPESDMDCDAEQAPEEQEKREDIRSQARRAISFCKSSSMQEQISRAKDQKILVTQQELDIADLITNYYDSLSKLDDDFNAQIVKIRLKKFVELQDEFQRIVRSKETNRDRQAKRTLAEKALEIYKQHDKDRSKTGREARDVSRRLHVVSADPEATRLQVEVMAARLTELCRKLDETERSMRDDKKGLDRATKDLDEYIDPEELGRLREGRKDAVVKKLEQYGFRCTWLGENDAFGFGSFYEIKGEGSSVAYLDSSGLSGPELRSAYRLYKNKNRQGLFKQFFRVGGTVNLNSIVVFMQKHGKSFDVDSVKDTKDFTYESKQESMLKELGLIDELVSVATRNLSDFYSPEGSEHDSWKIEKVEHLPQTKEVLIQIQNRLNEFSEKYDIKEARASGMLNGVPVSKERLDYIERLQVKLRNTFEHLDDRE